MEDKTLFGIHFGGLLSGDTVVAIFQKSGIVFMEVDEGINSDEFILNAAEHFKPGHVFIDAPLSLPGIYKEIDGCEDYHFRHADLDLKSISPMFVGGFAARAMRLKDELKKAGIEMYETCPKTTAKRFGLPSKGYKGSAQGLKCCRNDLSSRFHHNIEVAEEDIKNWQHLDALMSLMAAMNYDQGCADKFGNEDEGLIFI